MNIKKKMICALMLFFLVLIAGCRPALKERAEHPEQALVPVRYFYPRFNDDTDLESLAEAIDQNLKYLNRLDPDHIFHYGPDQFTCRQVIESQLKFLSIIKSITDPGKLNREIRNNFRVYRAAGRVGNRKVLFTGYFEPVYEASLNPGDKFMHPLYNRPGDLIRIDLSPFRQKYRGESIMARIEGNTVIPYYSREEIENGRALEDRGLEIAWLRDPVDVAFLHIQGSGRLRLQDEDISVGYAAANGREYRSIGRYMIDEGYLTREEMSMQAIRRYLASNPEKVEDILNQNPSYVFFDRRKIGPLGNIAVPITPDRSIALDSRIFPGGALVFVKAKKPELDSSGEIERWVEFSRFMMNQDTGGAITGAGRADIFWGRGHYAEMAAGHMNHEGDLYILMKK